MTRARLRRPVVALVVGLFAAFRPQEPPQEPQDGEIVIEFQNSEAWETEAGERVMLLTGDVRLEQRDVRISADRMLVWLPPEGGRPREVYAEGNVHYVRDATDIHADALYFHIETRRARVIGLQVRGRDAVSGQPFVIRADEAREVEPGRFRGRNIQATTCTYGEPHFDVTIAEGEIRGLDPKLDAPQDELFPYSSYRAVGRGIVPHVYGVPLGYIPYATYQKGQESFLRRARFGRRTLWGYFALTTWGVGLRRGFVDPLLPGEQAPPGEEDETWGDLLLHLDYRTERGWATGIGLKYEDRDYAGDLDAYVLFDRGPTTDSEFGRFVLDTGDQTRGRIRWFHRHRLSDRLRLELELSEISDRNFLREFFEQEFKEEKEQETTAYLRWLDGNMGAFAQVRPRTNSFQTQIEYLPRGGFAATAVPLWPLGADPVYLNVRAEAGNYRLRFDDALDTQDPRTWRADFDVDVARPIRLKFATLRPWIGARVTAYENDAGGDSDVRALGQLGLDARTELGRTYEVRDDRIGLNGLRHVVVLGVGYTNTPVANTSRSEFTRIDETDVAWKFEELYFEMEHRFLTRAPAKDGGWEPHEFLRAFAAVEFYPRPGRDTGFLNENNFLYPFRWVPLDADSEGVFESRPWSNVHWGVSFTPRGWFSAGVRGEYDPIGGGIPRAHTWLTLRPWDGAVVSLWNDFVSDVTNTFGANVSVQVAERWTLGMRTTYDSRVDRFERNIFTIERDLHDFVVGLLFVNDFVRDERAVLFEFRPKFLPSPPLWYRLGGPVIGP